MEGPGKHTATHGNRGRGAGEERPARRGKHTPRDGLKWRQLAKTANGLWNYHSTCGVLCAERTEWPEKGVKAGDLRAVGRHTTPTCVNVG